MLQFSKIKSGRFAIPIIYTVVGIFWILLSDRALISIEPHVHSGLYNLLNSAKGIIYVYISAILLGLLVTRFEKRSLKSEKQYRDIYMSNPYPIWFFDPGDYKFMSLNDASCFYYGYTRAELLSMTIFDIHPKEDSAALKQFFLRANSEKYEWGRWCHLKKGGEPIYVNISSLLTTFNEKPAIMVLVIDITEKVAFEQHLHKSQVNLESTLSSISDSYFTVDFNWVISSANSNFYERTGTSADVIGKKVKSVFPDADESVIFQAGTRAMEERLPTKIDAYYARLSKWLHVACYPTEEGIAVFFTDITERKEKEAEIMRQNEQLRRVSWLNSHEIRKPVASIISLVELLKISGSDHETAQILEKMQKCTADLDNLLHQINNEASRL